MQYIFAGQTTTLYYKIRNSSGALASVTNPTVYFYNSVNTLVGSTVPTLSDVGIYTVTDDFDWDEDTYRSFITGDISSSCHIGDTLLFAIGSASSYIPYAGTEEFITFASLSDRVENGDITVEYINDLLMAATERINQYCNRSFYYKTVTEKHEIDTQQNVLLKNYPVVSISSLTLEDTTYTSSDYDLDEITGTIVFASAKTGTLEVTYTYGEKQLPRLVNLVCKKLAGYYLTRQMKEGITGETLLGYRYDFLDKAEEQVLSDLQRFRNIRTR